MNKLNKCICKDCLAVARWTPSVIVKTPENDNVFKLDFNMPLCDNHKKEFGINDVVPDSSLAQIQKLFTTKFIHAPKRENMKLEWNPITIKIVEDLTGKAIDETRLNHGSIVK